MSIMNCIPGLVAEGKITQEQADLAEQVYGRRRRFYERSMAADAADAAAGADAAEAVTRAAERRKYLTLRQEKVRKTLLAAIMGGDGLDPKKLPRTIVAVDLRRRAIEGRAFALIDGILAAHRRTMAGKLRNPAQMDNIVRELFGVDTGDVSAKELADAWRQAGEMLRRRFNAAGGDIGKLEGWGLPQAHNSTLVRRAGWEAWRDAVLPNLDRARMIDEATGKPFDDEGLEAVLRDVYETIRTDGWAKRTPGATAGAKMMANRRAEHRFLHFRDADAWLAYQARFGHGSAFDAMMGHIRGMARDIAAMEKLGPNPEATVRWLAEGIDKQGHLRDGPVHPSRIQKLRAKAGGGDPGAAAIDEGGAAAHKLNLLWDEYTGSLLRPVNRNLALAGGTYRAIAASAKLGTASVRKLSDFSFAFTTRAFNGLPLRTIVPDFVKLLNPASDAERRLAIRLGLGAEGWAGMTSVQNRYLLEEMANETARRLSDFVLRASGLDAMNSAAKWANGLAWLGHLTEIRDTKWRGLGGRLQRAFQRYGMGEAEWDAIRATPVEDDGGVDWIKPHNIEDPEVGDKLLELIHSEGDFAVPSPDLGTRAILHSKAKSGTVSGELIRSGPLLFKTFAVSVLARHLSRMMEIPSIPGRLGYLALLMIPTTVMGIVSTEIIEMLHGRDPQRLGDPKLIAEGMANGGGLTLAGDVVRQMAENRTDALGQMLGGPAGEDLWNLSKGTYDLVAPIGMRGAGVDEDTLQRAERAQQHAPWKLARVALGDTPTANLWWDRLAFDRLVADQVHMIADPNYAQSFQRMHAAARREGQGYFWAPGATAPERAPDLSRMTAPAAPP